MNLRKTAEVVIIGGGVMGVSTAYHLARLGVADVVLLEKNFLASGPTGKSVANIRPYHGVEETVKIIRRANKVYLNFDEVVGGDIQFRKLGRVWAEAESKRQIVEDAVALSRRAGMSVHYLSIQDLEQMVPGIVVDGLDMAAYFPEAGYSNPVAVTEAYARRARELGARIVEETEVTAIEVSSGRVTSVSTSTGNVSTSTVVNASGIWSPIIGRMVGIDIPVTPTRGQGVVFRLPWDLPTFTPILHDGRTDYIFRCEPDNLINMVDTLEILEPEIVDPDTMPDDADQSILVKALDTGSRTFPALERASFRGGYSCAYDITPDESPIIEEAPEVKGFYNLVGWGGLGMQQARVAGELMAELITSGKTSLIDVSVFSSQRFAQGKSLPSAWLFKEIGIH
ncbi:MAG: NAD(P)/FAD-dependent oxidoreductase [Dehalococcoidia bacterium]